MPGLLNRRRSLAALVVAGIAVGGLAATAQSQSTKPGAAAGFTLKIGDTVPFTGDNGAYGPRSRSPPISPLHRRRPR